MLKKGLALTPVKFGIAFNVTASNQAGALVHVYNDGSVLVNHGGTEMGQGLNTKVAQVVAHELGIAALTRVRVTATDTSQDRQHVGDRRIDRQRPERQSRAKPPRGHSRTARRTSPPSNSAARGRREVRFVTTVWWSANGGAMPFEELIAAGVSGARAVVVGRLLRDAEAVLGCDKADRAGRSTTSRTARRCRKW